MIQAGTCRSPTAGKSASARRRGRFETCLEMSPYTERDLWKAIMVTARPQRQRRSIRLPSYDYGRPGSHFITVCTNQRLCLFGEVAGVEVNLSPCGGIVMNCWHDLVNHYAHVELDAFVVMPNHIHGIIVLTDVERRTDVGAGLKPAPKTAPSRSYGLPEVVRALKTFSSRRINEARATPGESVWQRNTLSASSAMNLSWTALASTS